MMVRTHQQAAKEWQQNTNSYHGVRMSVPGTSTCYHVVPGTGTWYPFVESMICLLRISGTANHANYRYVRLGYLWYQVVNLLVLPVDEASIVPVAKKPPRSTWSEVKSELIGETKTSTCL